MGLDITAYSKLKHLGKHPKDPDLNEGEPGGVNDWCYYDSHVQAFAYDSFPQSFRGIPVLSTSRDSRGEFGFLEAGCYEITDQSVTHRFHAGSYGGYNRWRANLAEQFNPQAQETDGHGRTHGAEPDPDKPFYELIWFADNEGCIGPEAAADLLADFRQCRDLYVPGQYADYDLERYEDWTRAFELAADDGLVSFH